jgi:hypothetical protein
VFPISTFMYLGAIYIFSRLALFGISIFLYCVRELSTQPQERGEGQRTAATKQWVAAVPCPPLRSCPRVHINDQHTNFQFGKLWIIKGSINPCIVNFLFGLRVSEIPYKTNTLDSHLPFICRIFSV